MVERVEISIDYQTNRTYPDRAVSMLVALWCHWVGEFGDKTLTEVVLTARYKVPYRPGVISHWIDIKPLVKWM